MPHAVGIGSEYWLHCFTSVGGGIHTRGSQRHPASRALVPPGPAERASWSWWMFSWYSFTPWVRIQCPLCAKYCSRPWGSSSGQNRQSLHHQQQYQQRVCILLGQTDNKHKKQVNLPVVPHAKKKANPIGVGSYQRWGHRWECLLVEKSEQRTPLMKRYEGWGLCWLNQPSTGAGKARSPHRKQFIVTVL